MKVTVANDIVSRKTRYTRGRRKRKEIQGQAGSWEVPKISEDTPPDHECPEELLESLELSEMQVKVEESEQMLETLEADE